MSQDARFTDVINARPEVVFDALTRHDGQEAFYGEPGWFVESACDLRVGGIWTVTFGPARDEVYRHDHVFRVIDRPSRLVLDTTESRPDGSIVAYETEFIFEAQDGKTLLTMIHRGLRQPTFATSIRPAYRPHSPASSARSRSLLAELPAESLGEAAGSPSGECRSRASTTIRRPLIGVAKHSPGPGTLLKAASACTRHALEPPSTPGCRIPCARGRLPRLRACAARGRAATHQCVAAPSIAAE